MIHLESNWECRIGCFLGAPNLRGSPFPNWSFWESPSLTSGGSLSFPNLTFFSIIWVYSEVEEELNYFCDCQMYSTTKLFNELTNAIYFAAVYAFGSKCLLPLNRNFDKTKLQIYNFTPSLILRHSTKRTRMSNLLIFTMVSCMFFWLN